MNNIVVPYDFDAQSDHALEQAIHLAKYSSSHITLLYVFEHQGALGGLFAKDQKKEMLYIIAEKMERLAVSMSLKSGIDINARLEQGRICSQIVSVAKEVEAVFIVMGTRSNGASEDAAGQQVGANTSRVIRTSPCPVITIGGGAHYHGCRTIMLPMDQQKETTQKTAWAIRLAKLYGAKINIVSALWPPNDDEVLTQINKQINFSAGIIRQAGIECETAVVISRPGDKTIVPALLEFAHQAGDVDLIIIMTQPESAIVQFFIDSQAQEFIRRSQIPVMSVIPNDNNS